MAFDKGIKLSTGFDLQSPFALDSRNKVNTLSELNSLTSNDVEPGHITFCEEDKQFYAYIENIWTLIPNIIAQKILYTTIPEIPAHYELTDSTTDGALVIVADGTLSNPDTEIELSSVTPLLDGDNHVYAIGEYVIHVNTVNSKTVEVYRKASESYTKDEVDAKIIASSTGLKSMTQDELDSFFNSLTITSSNYVAP